MPDTSRMVVVGQFAGPHGVHGGFKVRSFTDHPPDVVSYGPVKTEKGKALSLSLVRELKPGLFLCSAPEIKTPEACEDFKAALLHVSRDILPQTEEDEFYLDDLVGLQAITQSNEPAGRVKAVVNFGAGDLVELFQVPGRNGTVLIPFTREAVPEVNLKVGQLTVLLPEEDNEQEQSEG